jgi:dienelactone hydrolase
MRHSRLFIALFSVALMAAPVAHAATTTFDAAQTQGGIDAVLHLPDDGLPAPIIVIAPGGGYHMDMPLIVGFAEEGAKRGYAVLRFNWRSQVSGMKVDLSDLSGHKADFQAALALALAQPGTDAKRLIIAGKSLGSIVGWGAFAAQPATQPKALAAILFTPLCIREAPLLATYPGVLFDGRPVALIVGDNDALCPQQLFRKTVAMAPGNVAPMSVLGDHVYYPKPMLPPAVLPADKATDATTLENVHTIIKRAYEWLDLQMM